MRPTPICPKTVEDLVSWQIKVNFKGSRCSFCFIFRRRQTQVTVRPTWQDLAHLRALQKMKEQNGTKRTTDSLIRFRTESVVEDRIKISTLLPDIFVTDNNTSVFRLGRVLARASRGHTCLRSWFLKKQKKETFYLSGTVQWYVFALTQRILIKQHGAKHRRYDRETCLSRDGSGVDGRASTHLIRIMFQRTVVAHVSYSVQICVPLVHVVHEGTVVLLIQYPCQISLKSGQMFVSSSI